MPRIEKVHSVQHRAEDMFALVCDVESYPQFVPLCKRLTIEDERNKNGKRLLVASMTMAYGMLSETFKTRVLMDESNLEVDVKYVDGPFRHLENNWKFENLDNGMCEVSFLIDYELRNQLLSLAASTVFESAFGKFAEAFEERADTIYGIPTV